MLKIKFFFVLLLACLALSLVEKAEATSLAEPIGEKATNARVFLVSIERPLWSAEGLGSFQAIADRPRPMPRRQHCNAGYQSKRVRHADGSYTYDCVRTPCKGYVVDRRTGERRRVYCPR
jgi:hypothetical protein